MKTSFGRITIIGLGLIGSSLARAIRAKHLSSQLHGIDSHSSGLNYALTHNIIDFAHKSYEAAIPGSTLVLLCTPPSAIPGILDEIQPYLDKNALVMDTASVKGEVAKRMEASLGEICDYMPAHPVAGSEKTGPEAGSAELFEERRVILCPREEQLSSPAVKSAQAFWEALGSKVEFMPPELHDRVYGYVSHLPQLLAFAAKEVLAKEPLAPTERMDIFRKFMRLGQSSGALWSDIFIENGEVLCEAVDQYLSVAAQIYTELTSAMVKGERSESSPACVTELFPRIAASCLVTALSIVEPEIGTRLLRFAGAGLADFTAPVTEEAEQDIERIAKHYRDIMPVLAQYMQAVQRIKHLIKEHDSVKLRSVLTAIQQKALPL